MIHRRRDGDDDERYREPARGNVENEGGRTALQGPGDPEPDEGVRPADDRMSSDCGDLLFRYKLYNG